MISKKITTTKSVFDSDSNWVIEYLLLECIWRVSVKYDKFAENMSNENLAFFLNHAVHFHP